MNKRLRKKKENGFNNGYIFYLKLLLNENNKFNPAIKFKGWTKFLKGMEHYSKKYGCDIAFKCPEMDTRVEEFERGVMG